MLQREIFTGRNPSLPIDWQAVEFRQALSEEEVLACFPAMNELWPHLDSANNYAKQIKRMSLEGYELLVAWQDRTPLAMVGYRTKETLAHGRYLYVEDLITIKAVRNNNLGEKLINRLLAEASRCNCSKLLLDTKLDNVLAQRFTYRVGMLPISLQFSYYLDHT